MISASGVVAGPVARAAAACRGLSGWRRYALAFGAGAVTTAAFAPVHAIPLLLITFPVLIWLIDGSRSNRAAFFAGWWFGFGHFVTGLYWIAHALLTNPEKFGWMIPFAVGGLSALLSVYPGLATLATRWSRSRGVGRILILAAAWTLTEWLRGHLLTGFPWNLTGNVWTVVPPVLQSASVVGAYGLTLLTVLVASAPAVLGDEEKQRWRPLVIIAILFVAVWAGGVGRLSGATDKMVPGVTLRIVQPNIGQHHKWRDERRRANFAKLMKLSTAPGADKVTAVIWPETAAPFIVGRDQRQREVAAKAIPRGGLLITGTMRLTSPGRKPFQLWNSVQAVDTAGAIRATYDKFHLVPFGEYVPLSQIFGFAKVTAGAVDFSSGPGPRTINLPGLPPVSPLICYEIIFPGAVSQQRARPAWLLNLTNDAWFGISSGPHQHLASAQMRSVEEGLPLVRAANTGISAVFDGYGRRVASLALGVEGIIDAPLPTAIPAPTIYARANDWLMLGFVILSVILGFNRRFRRR